MWGPWIDDILLAKLIDALGYDPTKPIDPKTNPKFPASAKERNDILDRLIGPAFALHQPQGLPSAQITFLDILIQSKNDNSHKVIDAESSALPSAKQIEDKMEEDE